MLCPTHEIPDTLPRGPDNPLANPRTTERSDRYCHSFRWRQKMKRRDFVKKAGIGSAALVSLPDLADALTIPDRALSPLQPGAQPPDTFLILLDGPYRPVVPPPG